MRTGKRRGGGRRTGGFALLEVIAFAAILGLAVAMLHRTLLAAEVSLLQARTEATIGRALRFHANLLVNCAYDLLPAEGEQSLESGHSFRPFRTESGAYEERLPYAVWVARQTIDRGTEAELSELRLRVEYSVGADPGAAATSLPPARVREHPVILRRPGTNY